MKLGEDSTAFTPGSIQETEELTIDKSVTVDTDTPVESPVINCPSCGVDVLATAEQQITDEDKQGWIRHIFGAPRFTREYKLFGSVLVVVLQTRTDEEADAILAQLRSEFPDAKLDSKDRKLLQQADKYMLAYSLASYVDRRGTLADIQHFEPSEDGVIGTYVATVADLPPVLYSALMKCLRDFDSRVHTLKHRGTDSDFWQTTDESA